MLQHHNRTQPFSMKLVLKFLLAIILAIVVVAAVKFKTIKRLYTAIHLFDENVIIDNFQNMDKHFKVVRWEASDHPISFPKNISYTLPDNFSFKDSLIQVNDYLSFVNTEGLMIIHRDTVVFEQYMNGLTESTTHISWSMAKSVVATLMGIAYDEGLYQLDDPVTQYLPQFKGTAYDGVKIKDILQMSSGVRFNEDYGDFNSDINRFGRAFAMGSSLEKFAMSLERERKPGTYCHYVSMDTQVLGILLIKLTGMSLTDYLKLKLWEQLGMQDQAEWLVDNTGLELALGGLNMTLRDYAKLGQLYLHDGMYNDQQIVSKQWIEMATTPDALHLMPGENEMSSHDYGYGFQWWIPNPDEGDFFAAGIYNQYIYVQPEKELVIVKLSANHHFKHEGQATKGMHIGLFKTISATFPDKSIPEKIEVNEQAN